MVQSLNTQVKSISTVKTATNVVNNIPVDKDGNSILSVENIKKVKPAFASKYIINLKSKEFMLYNGLVLLSKEKGMKSLTVDVIQFPTKDNNNTAICKATLKAIDPVTKDEFLFSDIGDANLVNCTKLVANHYIRMASTRAKGRAMRDFLGVDTCMFEELGGDSVIEQTNNSSSRITELQLKAITELKKKLNWDTQKMRDYAQDVCGINDLSKYTIDLGNLLITSMNRLVE